MKNKVLKSAVIALIVIAVALAGFTAGYFTHKLSRGNSVSSYEWFVDTVGKYYYFGADETQFTGSGLSYIADKYLDKYSEYYTKEEYEREQKSNEGSKSGLGLSYGFAEGKGIYVASVVGNSPAYMQGLRAGEWLVSGGKGGEVSPFNSASDFSALVSSADDGEAITLVSAGGKEYTAAKAEYTASYTYMATQSTAWTFGDSADGGLAMYETPNEKIPCLPQGCAYIRLSQFYGTADKEFYRLIEKFNAEKCTSLVLDLRTNGGGYVRTMQAIAGCFAEGESKLAMVARDKNGKEQRYNCAKISDPAQRVSPETEVYVLANSSTASASEALMGAMICYGALGYENIFLSDYSEEYLGYLKKSGGEVKTARTYGKGIMQTPFENKATGEVLKLTTAKIFWSDSTTSIHDRGITVADGCIPLKAQWQHTLPDSELELACEIISKR